MPSERRPPLGRWARRALAAAVLLATYAATGFLLAPWILHRQLEKRLGAELRRTVTIERVRTNPFALSVTIDGLLVRDRDGATPFVSWERLYVNAKVWPFARREARLDAITLAGLRVNLSLGPDGRLNVDDIVEARAAEQASAPAPEEKPSALVLGVDHLLIDRAQVVFVDRSRGRPFETTVGPVTIQLDGFRTHPDAKSPYAFSGTTESGERFTWAGDLRVKPLRSSGEIALDDFRLTKYRPYYEREVGFDVREGLGAARARYDLELGPRRRVTLSDGSVSVRDLSIGLRGSAAPMVELPRIDALGIAADVLGRTAEVAKVAVVGGVVRVRRDAEGRLDVAALAPPPKPPPANAPPPYRWTVAEVAVAGYRIEVEDAFPRRPVKLVVASLDAELRQLASSGDAPTRVKVSAVLNEKGRVQVEGTAALRKAAAELAVRASAIDLPPLDPYLETYGGLAARLGDGALSVDGRARVDAGATPLRWAFQGDVGLAALKLVDAGRGEELVRWKDLQVTGVEVASEPTGARVRAVRWVEPRVRVHVAEDRSTNLRRILGPPLPKGEGPAKNPAAVPYPFAVGSFQIVRGRAGLVDRSVRPSASLGVTELDVRVRNLSNALDARSDVAVRGLVGGAPVEVKGTLSPRFVNDATNLTVGAKGVDLTPLGPYCAKYVGYVLEKGKLDLDLAYRVAKRQLEGKNVARVDQFTLGDSTSSPDATKLPVKLGLAILRDRDGVIDAEVPVSGNVDDPDFSLGKMIWHAIVNVFTKAVTAPFSLLGKLFGSGDEKLDAVDFKPGTAELTSAGESALGTLAKALEARPALRLEMEGTADAAADGKILREAELRRRAREAKWKASGGRGGARTPDDVVLLEDEYLKWIEVTYRAAFPDGRRAMSPPASRGAEPVPAPAPPDHAEMEARLLETAPLAADALPGLAQQRAEAVRDRLAGGSPPVAPERLFLARGGERAAKEGGARVYFTLK